MEFGLENAGLRRLNRHQRRSLTAVEVDPILIKRWASANSSVVFCDWSDSASPLSSSSHSSLSAKSCSLFGQKSKSAFQLRSTSVLVAPLAIDDEDEANGINRRQQSSNIIIAITSAEDEPDHLMDLTDGEDCSTPSQQMPIRCGSKRPTDWGEYFIFLFLFLFHSVAFPLTSRRRRRSFKSIKMLNKFTYSRMNHFLPAASIRGRKRAARKADEKRNLLLTAIDQLVLMDSDCFYSFFLKKSCGVLTLSKWTR